MSSRPLQHAIVFFLFKIIATLTNVKWYFIVILICISLMTNGASLMAQTVKNPPAMLETWDRSLGGEDPLEKGMATHSSILAWRMPWAEDVEHLLMYSLGICRSSLEKCPFKSPAHLLFGFLHFCG